MERDAQTVPGEQGDAERCCICLESLETPGFRCQRLPCSHTMHEQCINALRRHGATQRCPLCREDHEDLTPVEVLYNKARLHAYRKAYTTCIHICHELLDVDPQHVNANNLLCYCYKRLAFNLLYKNRGDLLEAEALALESWRRGCMDAANFLGCHYVKRGDLPRAQTFYEEARHHGIAGAANNLGYVHQQQGDLERARELYEEAWRGGSATAASNLGYMFLGRGDLQQAEKFFEEGQRGGYKHAALGLDALRETRNRMTECEEISVGLRSVAQQVEESKTSARGECGQPSRKELASVDQASASSLARSSSASSGGIGRMHNPQAPELVQTQQPESVIEDILAQGAMEEDARVTASAQTAAAVDAQVSAALMQSSSASDGLRVCMLRFRRRPDVLREALLRAPELAERRDALEQRGFAVELPSGAKVFVDPEQYEATMEALRLADCRLYSNHVIVDAVLEPAVLRVVRQISFRQKLYLRDSHVVPLAFPEQVLQPKHLIEVYRTFINVRLPNTMQSESEVGVRTVSTTDADPRNGDNHRPSRI